MTGCREVYKAGGDKSSLNSEFWWRALQSTVVLRTGSPLCRGKNSPVAWFAFLILSLNPYICSLVFIICATVPNHCSSIPAVFKGFFSFLNIFTIIFYFHFSRKPIWIMGKKTFIMILIWIFSNIQ